ncbi:interferon gamma receptor 2 [Cheilinus undulatus]|uniref:interferon gamma receptor 2 n=1 Tax=Cheilinus undulatus TaxID=241271 RepID=UPI001BD36B3A|nr:interferon gamma receptor 2 [Cheilinus undulatus]
MVVMVLAILHFLSASVLTEDPPPSPRQVRVLQKLLTWTPPPTETDLTYSVQSRYHADVWRDVPSCVHISSTSCDVTVTSVESRNGCVRLRVRAERRGLNSPPVEACSLHGDSCTPAVSLTARPTSLTVYLSRNHSLAEEHAAHVEHRVNYTREGDTQQLSRFSPSSVTLPSLEEGQRYCTQVEFMLHGQPVGPPSCPLCETIPHTGVQVSAGVVAIVVIVLILMGIASAYVLLFKGKRIKQWLRPPYKIPDDFHLQRPLPISTYSLPEENCDVISSVIPKEQRE